MIGFLKRHWTIRVRLTVLYGGLFFLAGTLLLGVTYVLVAQRLEDRLGSGQNALTAAAVARTVGSVPLENRQRAVELYLDEQRRIRADTLDSLLTQGGIALGGVGAVAVAFGWLLAGRAMRPINGITETARRIAGADSAGRGLHERIALAGPRDEVKQLADTFDLMLERLDQSFEGQRRFIASASHELRTPLAINRALIEVATTRQAASADAKELGSALLEVNARHERLIDGLLTLADSENEVVERHPVDLAELADQVLSTTVPGAVRVHRPDLGGAPTAGDPYLLERLVQNLVENAVRHNLPDGGWLSVRTWSTRDRAMLAVANSGPVVRRYETEALFQPFRRLNGARVQPGRGFGLGLSIARAVARSHAGEVHAEPREGGGLVVTLSLPLVT
jgi:signal transduction histidine kinase